MNDDMRASARADLEQGLAQGAENGDAYRASVAAGWKPDPEVERMRALYERDPDRFDQMYGARGAITVGFYEAAERAATPSDPDEAA